MNLVESTLAAEDGRVTASLGRHRLPLPDALLRRGLARFVGSEVVLGIRPEDLEDAALAAAEPGSVFEADVLLAEPLGAEVIAHLEVEAAGEPVGLVARLNPRSRADTGDRLAVVADVERLHFFDPETLAAIS
jgi:multiple sugar transport system ATP-binding protein